MPQKPIRVFWSALTNRFYASQHYRQVRDDYIVITGQKFDVTDDIANAVIEREITFTKEENDENNPVHG